MAAAIVSAAEKLSQAKTAKTGATLTLDEFVAISEQTLGFGDELKITSDNSKNIKAIIKKVEKTRGGHEGADPITLTQEEVDVWVKSFLEHGNAVVDSSSYMTILHEWMAPQKEGSPHPLDGQMDMSANYEPKVAYIGGSLPRFYSSVTQAKPFLKYYFFHMLTTIFKLEEWKRRRKEATLSYLDVSAVMQMLDDARKNRPDTLPKYDHNKLQPFYTAARKMLAAVDNDKGTRLTRAEVRQVLNICGKIPRPKPKSSCSVANMHSAEMESDNVSQQLSDSDMRALRELYLTDCDPMSINGRTYYISFERSAKYLLNGVRSARENGLGYTADPHTALGILLGCRTSFKYGKYSLVEPSSDPMHSQVTAVNKLITAHSVGILAHLDIDEVIYLDKVLQDMMDVRSRCQEMEGISDTLFASSQQPDLAAQLGAAAPGKRVREGKEDTSGAREIYFKDAGAESLARFPLTDSEYLEEAAALANMLLIWEVAGPFHFVTPDIASPLLNACRVLFKLGNIALVDPETDPMNPQVTVIDKLIQSHLRSKSNPNPHSILLNEEELACLSKIFQQAPALRAKHVQTSEDVRAQQPCHCGIPSNLGRSICAPKYRRLVPKLSSMFFPTCRDHKGQPEQAVENDSKLTTVRQGTEQNLTKADLLRTTLMPAIIRDPLNAPKAMSMRH